MSAALAPTRLKIDFKPPLDLATSLAPLGRWGDDGLDRWDGATLVRTTRLADGDHVIPYRARAGGDIARPHLEVATADNLATRVADELSERLRGSFVAMPAHLTKLAGEDHIVGRLVERYPGVAPVLITDAFAALIRSVSAQQVNLRWAATIRRRIAERYGTRHDIGDTFVYSLEPEALARARVGELRDLQLTTAKARSVIAVAEAAAGGELARADLDAMEDEPLIAHLTRLRGIGRWSAEWFLTRTLGRPRVVAGDLGVRKAVGRMYGADTLPSEQEVRRLTAHWGESATFVQALALHDLAGTGPAG